LAKLRAKQLLTPNLGDSYETAEGKKRTLSLGVAAIYWPIGQRMLCDLSKREDEIGADDPESRKADALAELSDERLRAIIEATDDPTKGGSK
jgi:hypothetical protein